MPKSVNRREFLRTVAIGAAGVVAASCAAPTPQVIEKIVEKPVDKIVQQTVVVEKEKIVEKAVEKVVPQTVVVEKLTGGLPVPRAEAAVINETTVYRIFDSMNPYIPNGLLHSGTGMVLSRLMYLNWATGESVHMLVESYKYNDKFDELTFKTRKEAKWNDGKPFTAKDIAFTVNMLKANVQLSFGAAMKKWVDSVTVPDDYTVTIKLTAPNPRFHWNFKSQSSCVIVQEAEWKGKDPTTYKAFPPIGTGPYKFHSAVPEARMYIYQKVDNWWGKALGYDPGPKYTVWQTSPPPEAEIQDIADNYIDHSHSYTSDAKLLRRTQDLNKAVVLAPWRDPCPRGIWFNCAKYPLSKPEVRWALHHCIDKKKAAETLYPWPTVPATYHWADWDANKKFDFSDVLKEFDLEFNVATANKILDDLGFKKGADGIRVDDKGAKMEYSILVPQVGVTGEYPIALDFAENLGKAGIKASVKWLEYPPFNDARELGTFDITSHWWCGNWQEPPYTYASYLVEQLKPVNERATAGNWPRVNDPELDKLVKQMEGMSPDDPKIMDVYKQAFRVWMKNLPAVPVVQTTFVMPFNTKYWKGWPDEKNIYAVPFTWWPEFQFVLYKVTKA